MLDSNSIKPKRSLFSKQPSLLQSFYDILKKYDRLQRAICRFMTSRRLLAHSRIQVSSFSNVF